MLNSLNGLLALLMPNASNILTPPTYKNFGSGWMTLTGQNPAADLNDMYYVRDCLGKPAIEQWLAVPFPKHEKWYPRA